MRILPHILVVITLSSCAPQLEDCNRLLPVAGTTTIEQHANGPTCTCHTWDGVIVTAPLVRQTLRWERRALYVDGKPVTIEEFHGVLQEARARRRIQAAAAQGRGAATAIIEEATKAAQQLREHLRR